ncbi:MAG: hypothetical protein CHACPFDD_00801 [Phycisphaerae bacterium]|nr:hypothetical protein [Phycisphaerae bacterium]
MSETPASGGPEGFADDVAAIRRLRETYEVIRGELSKVIVGQQRVLDEMLIALFARGHVILEGVPGLAKTLMISSLARCLGLNFRRIQFTPDLMPSDITGTEVIQEDRSTGHRSFRFLKGPIFSNVLLADEVNRTPPKTQAALLEAMQEQQVTIGGVSHAVEPPFFVLATQNPIEQEGTYPLPEAQQDRFMLKVFVDYPSYDDEYEIAVRTTSADAPPLSRVLERAEILGLQAVVRRVPAAPSVVHHAIQLARATRPGADASEIVNRTVTFGAGPRAVQFMLMGAKARAVIHGRKHVSHDDVRALAHPVLRHRILTNYAAEAEGQTTDTIIDHVLALHPARETDGLRHAGVEEVLKA